jgi:hypothetical protein
VFVDDRVGKFKIRLPPDKYLQHLNSPAVEGRLLLTDELQHELRYAVRCGASWADGNRGRRQRNVSSLLTIQICMKIAEKGYTHDTLKIYYNQHRREAASIRLTQNPRSRPQGGRRDVMTHARQSHYTLANQLSLLFTLNYRATYKVLLRSM